MAVFRVVKTKDYTRMDNSHFKNRKLSFKAIGILSLMLSLPDTWRYSLQGLTMLAKDGLDSVRGGIKELEEQGYLVRSQLRNSDGTLGDIKFDIYEGGIHAHMVTDSPQLDFPSTDKPLPGKPSTENPTQVITNESITNKAITKRECITLPAQTIYGEFQTVKLSAEEHSNLVARFGTDIITDYIRRVDTHQAKNRKQYKNHYATIIDWITQDQQKKGGSQYAINGTNSNACPEEDPYKEFMESG